MSRRRGGGGFICLKYFIFERIYRANIFYSNLVSCLKTVGEVLFPVKDWSWLSDWKHRLHLAFTWRRFAFDFDSFAAGVRTIHFRKIEPKRAISHLLPVQKEWQPFIQLYKFISINHSYNNGRWPEPHNISEWIIDPPLHSRQCANHENARPQSSQTQGLESSLGGYFRKGFSSIRR